MDSALDMTNNALYDETFWKQLQKNWRIKATQGKLYLFWFSTVFPELIRDLNIVI